MMQHPLQQPTQRYASAAFSIPVAHQPTVVERAAHWVFSIPNTVENTVTHGGTTQGSALGRLFNGVIKKIGDFDHFTQKQIGPLKLMEPSKGAFFFLVIPLTVIPRVYQAFNREDNRFKWTELGDILRRDMMTLFSLLYAFGPFQSWMTRKAGLRQGITLQDPLSGKVFQSSDTSRLYTLGQHGDVERILTPWKGSNSGLITETALKSHYHKALNGLEEWIGIQAKGLTAALTNSLENTAEATTTQLLALSDAKTMAQQLKEHLSKLGGPASSLKGSALTHFDATFMEGLHTLETRLAPWADETPNLRNVLAHAADATRTPVSVISFLLVCALIGVAPDVFNKGWNQRRFARLKQEAIQKQGEAILRRLNPSVQALTPLMTPLINPLMTGNSLSSRQIQA